MEKNIQVNMYEFNKINMAQIEPLAPAWIKSQCKKTADEILNSGSQYWMLLCRERNDITIFNLLTPSSNAKLANEIHTTLDNRGYILDFVRREDGNYEIWIRDITTEENFVYYLFNYANGVIEV